jgi:YidC/Oxa1 family membrane protein insertase
MLMYVFPLIFAVMGINFPVGVLVYWLTTNVWTMGQQMFVIHRNPTPGSQAQAGLLERIQKHVVAHTSVPTRHQRNIIKGIASKETKDRNDAERKFIATLGKSGLVAQPDGTVEKSEAAVAAEAEGMSLAEAAPKRQQPKRQTKAKRQTSAVHPGGAEPAEADAETKGTDSPEKTSLDKKDEPQDTKPRQEAKSASGSSARQAKPGQRKGQQRPKHPSKK